MDTLGFFKAILPSEGVYFIGLMRADKHGIAHIACKDVADVVATVKKFDGRVGVTVYHACSSYKEAYVQHGEKKKYRVPENAHAAKAFWIDLDVGQEKAEKGKGYATKNDAWVAIRDFCKAQGFPMPLVVDSGGGVHCYWPLTADLSPAAWKGYAEKLKAVLRHFNVLADPTRTADFASILRPVGAHNKKQEPWREVKVVKENGPYDIETIDAALEQIIEAHHIEYDALAGLGPVPAGFNEDLLSHTYPEVESDADVMASKCKQVQMMRDTQGDVEYEHWRGVIGLLTFCTNGREKAIEWNARRAETGHGQTDALSKYDTWGSGPSTCAFFENINPSGCEGCPNKGNVKSPIILGRVAPEPAPATVEEVVVETPAGEPEKVEVIEVPEEIEGYQWQPGDKDQSVGQMVRFVFNHKDNAMEVFPFARYRFYLVSRIMGADGTFQARIRMHMPKNKIRHFEVPTAVLASGGNDLMKELGKHELTLTNNKDALMHITAYLRDSLNKLVQTTDEINTMVNFGWKNGDSFLIGDRLYKSDGTMVKVVLGHTVKPYANTFPEPKGSASMWAEGVNFIYNRKGMECMQYAICSGFGSLLSPFGEDLYKGIPVALTSEASGKGKTTACRAALYAFGQANDMTINGKDGSTVNARGALMGVFNNIPLLIDEITAIKSDALSPLLYAASNGKERIRQQSVGGKVTIAETNTWAMSLYMTANKHLGAALGGGQANTKAEANRIMEIKVDCYPIPVLNRGDMDSASRKIEGSIGSAGEEFVKWIVCNRPAIAKLFLETTERISGKSAHLSNPEYRYFRQHAVCTLVAARILKDLGLVDFDLEAMESFTIKLIDTVVTDAEQYNEVTKEEAINQMISALSPAIIATKEYRTKSDARGPETVVMHQAAVGRYIAGDALDKEPLAGRLYLVKKSVRDWCNENRVSVDSMIMEARNRGWLVELTDDKFLLGRGTNLLIGALPCYCFDMRKMHGEGTAAPLLSIVGGDKEA